MPTHLPEAQTNPLTATVHGDNTASDPPAQEVLAKLTQLLDQFSYDLPRNNLLVLQNILELVQSQLVLFLQFDLERQVVENCLRFGLEDGFEYQGAAKGCVSYQELVVLSQKQFIINDLQKSVYAQSDPFVRQYGFESVIGTAVILNDRVVGAIVAFDRRPFRFSSSQASIIELSARLMAFGIDRQVFEKRLKRKVSNGQLISMIASNAIANTSGDFLHFCLDQSAHWAHADSAAIFWYNSETLEFQPDVEWWSADASVPKPAGQTHLLRSLPFVDEVLTQKQALICEDPGTLNGSAVQALFPHQRISSILVLPLCTERKVLGFFSMQCSGGHGQWEPEDVHALMTIANIVAQWQEARSISKLLDESQALNLQMVQLSPTAIYHVDLRKRRLLKVNEHILQITGYSEEELLSMDPEQILTPESREHFRRRFQEMASGQQVPNAVEYQIKTKSGNIEWGMFHVRLFYESGQIAGATVVAHIITEHKQAMEELAEYRMQLEALVKERTKALSETNQKLSEEIVTHTQTAKELHMKTEHLKELNTALGVLLDKRNEDRVLAQEYIRVTLRQLIEPYLDRLDASGLSVTQQQLLNVVRVNLNDVVGAPIPEMAAKYYIFTPNEMQVANLIQKGRTTKEMARLLNLSSRTVESYRNSIRKKLGLQNRKVNLRTYLSSKD